MTLALRRSADFNHDFELQYRWYLEQAGEAVAERYLNAVLSDGGQRTTRPGWYQRFPRICCSPEPWARPHQAPV